MIGRGVCLTIADKSYGIIMAGNLGLIINEISGLKKKVIIKNEDIEGHE